MATALLESRASGRHQVFVMDEPAAGLHPSDVRRLLGAFEQIVAEGHSLLLIEHNLTVIGASDWLMDLGPGCGPDGGRVLFAGPVAEFLPCWRMCRVPAREPPSPPCLVAQAKPAEPPGSKMPHAENRKQRIRGRQMP